MNASPPIVGVIYSGASNSQGQSSHLGCSPVTKQLCDLLDEAKKEVIEDFLEDRKHELTPEILSFALFNSLSKSKKNSYESSECMVLLLE